jgi:hypothetical protein
MSIEKESCMFAIRLVTAALIFAGGAIADVVLDWNAVALDAIRANNTAPPLAARNLAILHAAIFDAVNGIGKTHRPYLVPATGPDNGSVETAASAAARRVMLALYPSAQTAIDAAYQRSLPGNLSAAATLGIQWGEAVATQILQRRSNDGSGATVQHTPGTQPGQWRPTISFGGIVRPALLAGWGSVTPFALMAGTQFRPPAPPQLSSPEYASEVNLVRAIGGAVGSTRTVEQTQIAQFWGYGSGTATPPGHWNQVAQAVVRPRGGGSDRSIARNARLFALLNIAMADSAIVSWDCKYVMNFWRPITAIREADSDGNAATQQDTAWTPLLATPPFPEYTSGHSTFSAAAAVVLASFFGADRVRFSVESDDLPGVRRTYRSFSEAALESGISRIYGGIHFPSANVHGLSTGAAVGMYVAWNVLTPIDGSRDE